MLPRLRRPGRPVTWGSALCPRARPFVQVTCPAQLARPVAAAVYRGQFSSERAHGGSRGALQAALAVLLLQGQRAWPREWASPACHGRIPTTPAPPLPSVSPARGRPLVPGLRLHPQCPAQPQEHLLQNTPFPCGPRGLHLPPGLPPSCPHSQAPDFPLSKRRASPRELRCSPGSWEQGAP